MCGQRLTCSLPEIDSARLLPVNYTEPSITLAAAGRSHAAAGIVCRVLMGAMTTKKNSKTPQCECGCGANTKGGRFLPGHDAKLKKALLDSALGGSKRAANKLEKLGWKKFLDAKQAAKLPTEASAEPEQ